MKQNEDVAAERRRQVEAEGWTPEHDDEHSTQELAFAAACYATADEGDAPPAVWPWHLSWWKPTDRRHNLVKAGALILAEIDRIDRTAARNLGTQESSSMSAEPEKCYSTNREDFNHSTLWDALNELDENSGLRAGVTIYEAEANRRTAGHYFDTDSLFEQMGERAYEHGGEHADDFPDVSPEKEAELKKLVRAWLDANVKVNFYTVSNCREIIVTESMIAEHLA